MMTMMFILVNMHDVMDRTAEQLFTCKCKIAWAKTKTHLLAQIAHPLQEFRSNGLVDYFSFCMAGRGILVVSRETVDKKSILHISNALKPACSNAEFQTFPRW